MEISRRESQSSDPQKPLRALPPEVEKQIEDLKKELNNPDISLEELEAVLDKLSTLMDKISTSSFSKEIKQEADEKIMQMTKEGQAQLLASFEASIQKVMGDPRLSEEQRVVKLQQLVEHFNHTPHLKDESQRAGILDEIQAITKNLTAGDKYQEIYDLYEKIFNDPRLSYEEKIKQLHDLQKEAMTIQPASRQQEMLSVLNRGILNICDTALQAVLQSPSLTLEEKLSQLKKIRIEVSLIDVAEKETRLMNIDQETLILFGKEAGEIIHSRDLTLEEKLKQLDKLSSYVNQAYVPQNMKKAISEMLLSEKTMLIKSNQLVKEYLEEINKILFQSTLPIEEKLKRVNELKLEMINNKQVLPEDVASKTVETTIFYFLNAQLDSLGAVDIDKYIVEIEKLKGFAEKYISFPELKKEAYDLIDTRMFERVKASIEAAIAHPDEEHFLELLKLHENLQKTLDKEIETIMNSTTLTREQKKKALEDARIRIIVMVPSVVKEFITPQVMNQLADKIDKALNDLQ